ncbi:MAG: histidine kinase [Bacteroidales bacterium]|nr:histidine kinase [Bacteroidales bacterium]
MKFWLQGFIVLLYLTAALLAQAGNVRFQIPCTSPDKSSSLLYSDLKKAPLPFLLKNGYGNLHHSLIKTRKYSIALRDKAFINSDYSTLAESWYLLGLMHKMGGNSDSADFAFSEAKNVYKTGSILNAKVDIWVLQAIIFAEEYDFKKALRLITEAKELYKAEGDLEGILFCQYNYAVLYRLSGMPHLAIKELLELLRQCEQEGNDMLRMVFYVEIIENFLDVKTFNTTSIYFDLLQESAKKNASAFFYGELYRLKARMYKQLNNRKKTIESLVFAKSIYRLWKLTPKVLDMDYLLSHEYYLSGKTEEALELSKSAENLARNSGFTTHALKAGMQMAEYYHSMGQLTRANTLNRTLLNQSNKSGINSLHKELHFQMYKVFISMNQTDSALANYIQYSELYYQQKSNAANLENDVWEMQYESNRHDNELNNIWKERERRLLLVYLLTGTFIIFVLIAFLLVRHQKIRMKMQEENMRERLLRLQLNPHFLFNALLAIQSYIYRKNSVAASYFLDRFASLIRLILDYSMQNLASIGKEVEIMNYYLEIQSIRFEGLFTYKVTIDPLIDVQRTMIPVMLAQPLLENSIEHAFHGIQNQGQINLEYILVEQFIMVIVRDNGIGINIKAGSEEEPSAKHFSAALGIIKERIAILNRRSSSHKISFKITLVDQTQSVNKGTEIRFLIPFRLKNND